MVTSAINGEAVAADVQREGGAAFANSSSA